MRISNIDALAIIMDEFQSLASTHSFLLTAFLEAMLSHLCHSSLPLRPLQSQHYFSTSADEAAQSARREYENYQERNRAMFLVIGGMLVLFALVMMLFAGEGGFITGGFLLAVTVFLFIVSRVAPRTALKYALSSPRDAYIAENGIIYEGAVYPFQSFLMRMDGATFRERTGKMPAMLIFTFTQSVGLSIRSSFDIEIPVPQGGVEKARKIAERESWGFLQ